MTGHHWNGQGSADRRRVGDHVAPNTTYGGCLAGRSKREQPVEPVSVRSEVGEAGVGEAGFEKRVGEAGVRSKQSGARRRTLGL
jgi:hypothetical protein